LGSFNLKVAQALCFIRALDQLVLDGKDQCQRFWSHMFGEKRSNRSIQIGTRNALARRLCLLNADVARRGNRARCGFLPAGDSARSSSLRTGHRE
jgi:hypothetical protein